MLSVMSTAVAQLYGFGFCLEILCTLWVLHCRVLARLYVVVRRLVILNDENMTLKGRPLPEDKGPGFTVDDDVAPSAPPKKIE